MVATTRAEVDIVVNGLNNLDKLQNKLDTVTDRFGRLRTALLGVGFAAFSRLSLQLADQIADLSAATDISIAKIKEFGDALEEAGGRGDAVDMALTTFNNKLEEARAGSLKAQAQFRNLGISLEDLGNPNTNELLDKTAKGMAALESSSARAAAAQDMFGKAGRGADPRQLAESLVAAAGSGDKYAESIRRAAELQGNFDKAIKELKLIFLEAFEPAIVKINELAKSLRESEGAITSITDLVKVLGIVLATTFAVGAAAGLVRILGTMGRGIEAVAKLAGVAAGSGIFRAAGPHMTALRGVVTLIAAISTAISASSLLFDDFGDRVANACARGIEALGAFAGQLLNLPTDLIGKIFGIKDPIGLGTPLLKMVENAKKSREEFERAAKARRDAAKPPAAPQANRPGDARVPVDTTALRNQVNTIKQIGTEYDRNINKQLAAIDIERQSIGQGKLANDIRRAQADIEEKNREAITKLKEERDKLNLSETSPEVIAAYDATIKRLEQSLSLDKARVEEKLKAREIDLQADKLKLYAITAQEDAEKSIQGIRDQTRKNILPDIQARYEEITSKIRENAQAAIKAEEAELPRGQKLSQQRIDQIYAAMTQKITEQKSAIDALVASEEQRRFNQFGLTNQQRLQEELNKATDDYNKLFLSPQQRILYDLEAAARAKAKAEVDALEIGRNQKLNAEERKRLEEQYYAVAIQGSEELGQKLLATRDLSRSWSYGWKESLQEYVDNATNAAQAAQRIFQRATQSMEDAFVNFAKTGKLEWKSFVASLAEELLRSQVRQLIGKLFTFGSGGGGGGFNLGDLFAGFFANGGMIPAGQFGVVGERGPELVSGPATVTPMAGTQMVTYNINAVDAASFKSMIARDPGFIHAVAQQGAKMTPSRR